MRLFDVGQAEDSINSEIRTSRARMSAGNSATSASTLSFNVSTVHAIAGICQRIVRHQSAEGRVER